MKRKHFFIAAAGILFLILSSCNKSNDMPITLDNSEPLALAPDVSWAVVNVSYTVFRTKPEWSAESRENSRKGEILQVKGNFLNNEKDIWYLFDKGWLPAESITIYNNRYKAVNAVKKLMENNN